MARTACSEGSPSSSTRTLLSTGLATWDNMFDGLALGAVGGINRAVPLACANALATLNASQKRICLGTAQHVAVWTKEACCEQSSMFAGLATWDTCHGLARGPLEGIGPPTALKHLSASAIKFCTEQRVGDACRSGNPRQHV